LVDEFRRVEDQPALPSEAADRTWRGTLPGTVGRARPHRRAP